MDAHGVARVGMAGWVFPEWRGTFYPKGVTQKAELAYAATQLTSIELNGSFYSLQKPASWRSWHDATPDDFVFAVKCPKFITQVRRLEDIEEPLANFFASGLLALGPKLGPVLWQLPPHLHFRASTIEQFVAQLPHTSAAAARLATQRGDRMQGKEFFEIDEDRPVRHAMEVRHSSYLDPAFTGILRDHGVAAVLGETAGKWPLFDDATADFRYLRLHGDTALHPDGAYSDEALDAWATRISAWTAAGQDVYVYFDTSTKVRSPIDARELSTRLGLRAD